MSLMVHTQKPRTLGIKIREKREKENIILVFGILVFELACQESLFIASGSPK